MEIADPTLQANLAAARVDPNWREKMQSDERGKMVAMILNTIRDHLVKQPNNNTTSDENALKDLAIKFEEVVFSQSATKDRYYSLIAQKIINLRNKTNGPIPNPVVAGSVLTPPSFQTQQAVPPTQNNALHPNQNQVLTTPANPNMVPMNPNVNVIPNPNPTIVPNPTSLPPNPNIAPTNPNVAPANPNVAPALYAPSNQPNMTPYTISTGMAVAPTIPNTTPNTTVDQKKIDPQANAGPPQAKNTWDKWRSLQHYAQNLSNMSLQIDGYIKGQNNGVSNNPKIQQYQLIVQRINNYRQVLTLTPEQFKEAKVTYDYLETMEKQINVWMWNYKRSSEQHIAKVQGTQPPAIPAPPVGSAPPSTTVVTSTTTTTNTPTIVTTSTSTTTTTNIPIVSVQPLPNPALPPGPPPIATHAVLDDAAQSNLVRIISESICSNDLEIKLKTSISTEISHLSRLHKGATSPLVISVLQNIHSSNTTPSTPIFTPVSTPNVGIGSPQNTDNNENNNNNNNAVNINVNTTVNINNTNSVQKSSMWWNPNPSSPQNGSLSQPTSPIQINCKEKQKLDKSEPLDLAPDKKRTKIEQALSPAGSSMSQFGSANKVTDNDMSGNQGEKFSDVDSSLCAGCKIPLPGPFEGVGMCCSCTLKKIEKNYESKLLQELAKVHESGWKIFSRFTPMHFTTYIYSPSTLFPLVVIFNTPTHPNITLPLSPPRFSFYYYKLSSDVSSLQKLREQFELSVERQKAYSSIVSISSIWSSILQSNSK